MQVSKLQLIQSLALKVCQHKQQICPPDILTSLMALPVPENFNLEYKAPSKESVEEGKDDTDINSEIQEYNHGSD